MANKSKITGDAKENIHHFMDLLKAFDSTWFDANLLNVMRTGLFFLPVSLWQIPKPKQIR